MKIESKQTVSPDIKYISEHLTKNICFPDFLETEIGVKIRRTRGEQIGPCNCPMPDHSDHNASFRINLMEDVWVFHCFGCGRSGSIITFCQEYFSLPNRMEAILYLCKKYNIKNAEDLILEGIKNISKRVNIQRMVENENMRVSNLCKMLLKKSFEPNREWVMKSYKLLNESMDNEDMDSILKIGDEAGRRLRA